MLEPHPSLARICAIIGVAWRCSENRRAFPVRMVVTALGVQIAVALVMLKMPAATRAGTSFVFGYVGGASPPFAVIDGRTLTSFAFQILALILVISAIAAVLWHWRVPPSPVRCDPGRR